MNEQRRSLTDLIEEIEEQSCRGDEGLIATALLVREVKHRIEAGEAGTGVKWLEWASVNFHLKKTQLYQLNHIACAKNPKQALDDYRFKQRERQKNRAERAKERDPERLAVIVLIRSMPIEKVRKVLKCIAALEG
jgi:vacuolar-type H+-ATPase subunit I/STV1